MLDSRSLRSRRLSGVPAGDPRCRRSRPARSPRWRSVPTSRRHSSMRARREQQTIADQIRFCEVPAPPFNESARAQVLRDALTRLGLENVRLDAAGNVIAERRGAAARPHLMIAAHLDTVFPPETNVKVSRSGALLRGPGISDNCRGLAVLVAIARALDAGRRPNRRPHHLHRPTSARKGWAISAGVKALFTATRGADRSLRLDRRFRRVNVSHVAVGSHRYRVTFKGPGGHSYGAFGLANPVGALGRAVAKLSDVQVPAQPEDDVHDRTHRRRHVGELDPLRSMDGGRHAIVERARRSRRSTGAFRPRWTKRSQRRTADGRAPGSITVVKELVGDRPAGETPLVVADRPDRACGRPHAGTRARCWAKARRTRTCRSASKIPAITIGGGGTAASGSRALRIVRRDRCVERGRRMPSCSPIALSAGVAESGAVRTLRSAFP